MDQRSFQTIKVGEQAFTLETMIYGGEVGHRQPLLIVHSIDFAVPPSQAFCEHMWEAGLQVIFVRRPGYGRSSALPVQMMAKRSVISGAAAIAEAAMLRALIDKLGLTRIILMAVGSSNPVCYRLIHMLPALDQVLFVNPAFNQDIREVFDPLWFRQMLKQIITSRGGLRVAEMGIKMMLKNDAIGFYQSIVKKSPGDLAYVAANPGDYTEAARIALATHADQLHYDTIMCLIEDPLLKDGYFEGVNAAILIGSETTPFWRAEMQQEAHRLNLPLYQAASGDIFCAYVSPQDVLSILDGTAVSGRSFAEPAASA